MNKTHGLLQNEIIRGPDLSKTKFTKAFIFTTKRERNSPYDQQGIETSSFEIEIPSKVTVKIIGEDHKGSFSLAW